MKFLVLGSGMMGSAMAFDLARSEGTQLVTVADIDEERAQTTVRTIRASNVRAVELDVNSFDQVVSMMADHDCALGATTYQHNLLLTKAAIRARKHFCDLGGNDEIVREQLKLSPAAKEAGVMVIPNCGLAPGLANIIAAQRANEFEQIDSIRIRVGCVPQQPKPPFNYHIVFSPEGLLNEYTGACAALRNGALTHLDPMTEIETVEFPPPFGSMEAFLTSGGMSLIPQMFEGRARDVDYKTIRYPGHCQQFRTLLDLGFAANTPISVGSNVLTNREFFLELLKKRIGENGKDVVLMSVEVVGIRHRHRQMFNCKFIDFFDDINNITATMRMTAFPTCAIAQLISGEQFQPRGVLVPEQCIPLESLFAGLGKRGIHFDEHWY
jgi:lysine 6-dehydrogenase